ncbi:MAG: hypothetical protein WCD76_05060 [Pyrinomonadaceae bacterium]
MRNEKDKGMLIQTTLVQTNLDSGCLLDEVKALRVRRYFGRGDSAGRELPGLS